MTGRRAGATATEDPRTGGRRPRVLHLAFEDPRRPGAGGGSVRTAEINRRLSEEFDVVAACVRFPGCAPYRQDGVRYTHIGRGTGYTTAIMSYFAAQAGAVRRWRPDLVVEDFGAPLSTWGLPAATDVPVVGVVQWLFAAEKAREYRLPFHLVERFGVSRHRRLVAVSEDLGERLSRMNGAAQVDVVPNALPPEAFTTPPAGRRRDVVFLGRVEDAQKGVSLLLRAYAQAVRAGLDQALVIAGTGPDESRMRGLAHELGVADRVRFRGHVALEDRFSLLAAAQVVAMPSRYETFGMVAAEALAVGTPVVAFDIPCLRNVVAPGTGRLVEPFDVDRFATALVEVGSDAGARTAMGEAGRRHTEGMTWDRAAEHQAAVYRAALREASPLALSPAAR